MCAYACVYVCARACVSELSSSPVQPGARSHPSFLSTRAREEQLGVFPFPSPPAWVLEHGEHFRIDIFEGCNFTGQCLEFVEDCPFLQSRGWAKNCVNAIKVYGDGA